MNLPSEKQILLNTIVKQVSAVRGVQAVVLGGSYARGTAKPASDLDIGLYYREDAPFDLDDIRRVAAALAPGNPPDVTDFYGWGQWVNGGAWIHTPVCKVDFLYRNIDQVQRAIDDAEQGILHHDFNQQPAYGFYSVIYLAETQVCLPLYDPSGAVEQLKARVAVYPPLLKARTVASTLWMAEFSLLHADGYGASANVYAAVGSLTRAAAFMTQALFALNETYFMTDKTAMQEIAAFDLAPERYVERLSAILARPGAAPAELARSVQAMRDLWSGIVALTGGAYQPAFRL